MSQTSTVARQPKQSTPPRGRFRRKTVVSIGITALAMLLALLWFSPLIMLVVTGLRTPADYLALGPISVPSDLTLTNFQRAWGVGNFPTTYRNSVFLVLFKVPLGVLLAAALAFALAKMTIPFRRTILVTVIVGLTVPIFITLVPIFVLVRSVGLIDNLLGLIGPYLAFGMSFAVLILHSFFKRLPDELFEAARVDGASNFRQFFQIALPLSGPVLVTVGILDVVATWNEFLLALTILRSESNKTLPLGLLNFTGEFSRDSTGLAAAILIAVVPLLVAYIFLQRYLTSGLTAGAVKG